MGSRPQKERRSRHQSKHFRTTPFFLHDMLGQHSPVADALQPQPQHVDQLLTLASSDSLESAHSPFSSSESPCRHNAKDIAAPQDSLESKLIMPKEPRRLDAKALSALRNALDSPGNNRLALLPLKTSMLAHLASVEGVSPGSLEPKHVDGLSSPQRAEVPPPFKTFSDDPCLHDTLGQHKDQPLTLASSDSLESAHSPLSSSELPCRHNAKDIAALQDSLESHVSNTNRRAPLPPKTSMLAHLASVVDDSPPGSLEP